MASAAASTVSEGRGRHRRPGVPGSGAGSTAVASGPVAASSAVLAAAALPGRAAGSLASSRAVIMSRLAGMPGRCADGGPGSSWTCR